MATLMADEEISNHTLMTDKEIVEMSRDSRFKFALESLKKCMSMTPETNIFFSPHLIYQNLLILFFGAVKETENSLRKVLYIPDDISKEDIQQYYKEEARHFSYALNGPDNSYACRIFSRLFLNENKLIYVQTFNLFSCGHHQMKEINFDVCPDHARNFVNNCVKCITQSHIPDILPPKSIDIDTDAILFNAIYCNGQLNQDFDLDISPSKKNKVMKKHYESKELNAYIMEVPYTEKKISMFFIFPTYLGTDNISDRDGIIQLIEQLTTAEGSRELKRILESGLTQQTDMLFPIFNIVQDWNMHQLLNALGLQEFTPSGKGLLHDLSSCPVKLGDAIHRIKIETTATNITATATNIFFTNNSCQHSCDTKMNTVIDTYFPCVCLIYDRSNHNILFCGILLES